MSDVKQYCIDNENGSTSIGEISVGSKVYDLSWEWEFRTGNEYTEKRIYRTDGTHAYSEKKPVNWIVVAKDHYNDIDPHVTLFANELIGKFCFDVRKKNVLFIFANGYAQWDLSGDSNTAKGLRTWLNSTGIHEGEGFYQAFSDNFKNTVLTTPVPNRDFQGEKYKTKDTVFIPSSKELGNPLTEFIDHDTITRLSVGVVYKYFSDTETDEAHYYYEYYRTIPKRMAKLADTYWWYWIRSLGSLHDVYRVTQNGEFYRDEPTSGWGGVRPTLNLKSGILVSEIKN